MAAGNDAMHATRAAVGGILLGGGVALLRAGEGLKRILAGGGLWVELRAPVPGRIHGENPARWAVAW
jgi:hypothetical protein